MKQIAIFSASDQRMKEYVSRELESAEFYNKEVQEYSHADIKDPEAVTVVSSFTDSEWNKQTIDYFPKLVAIATQSTGYDHIDIDYCKEQGIAVYNVPVYGAVTVAEYTWSLLLAMSRLVVPAYQSVQETQDFSRRGAPSLSGFDIEGKTLAVIGVGHIGHNVISRAAAFGMKIVAFDLHPDQELSRKYGVRWAESIAEAASEADCVTIHLPYNQHTHHLINEEVFGSIKPGAVFINTSRGEIVDTKALWQALEDGRVAQAALDVLEEEYALESKEGGEYTEVNQRLIADPRVIVTPHNAFNTKEALERIWQTTVANISHVLSPGVSEGDDRRVV